MRAPFLDMPSPSPSHEWEGNGAQRNAPFAGSVALFRAERLVCSNDIVTVPRIRMGNQQQRGARWRRTSIGVGRGRVASG